MMQVQLLKRKPRRLCWVRVTKKEAVLLIRSLSTQLLLGPNCPGRLESQCSSDSDVNELTVVVTDNAAETAEGKR